MSDPTLENSFLSLLLNGDREHGTNGGNEIFLNRLLGAVARGPGLERLDRDSLIPVARDQHDGNGWVRSRQRLDEFETIHLGHLQIGHHDIHGRRVHHIKGLAPVLGIADRPFLDLGEDGSYQPPINSGIINHQDVRQVEFSLVRQSETKQMECQSDRTPAKSQVSPGELVRVVPLPG
ncbi:MAG: hypothetical protein R3B96_00170 [Pirellulaceae bacterium]